MDTKIKLSRSMMSSAVTLHKVTGKCIYGVSLAPDMKFEQEPGDYALNFGRCPVCGTDLQSVVTKKQCIRCNAPGTRKIGTGYVCDGCADAVPEECFDE